MSSPLFNSPPSELASLGVTCDALDLIRRAWYAGRPVVPIIGAGFSADAGFPILSSICRYLARFKYALDHDLLIPQLTDVGGILARTLQENLCTVTRAAQEHPIRYIERFGWPDRFDLAQKVARHVCQGTNGALTHHERIEAEINKQYDWLAQVSAPPRAAAHWAKNVRDNLSTPSPTWDRWAVQGDWRRLIQFFTDHQGDYGDDLFAQFGFRRAPGPGHHYLTMLVRLLSVRTIFTFNFDDLIEKSLTVEGMPYRLFGMERGTSLPSPRLVGDDLSVIKMHGSHHSILIDETLDRPLTSAYIQRFYELTGPSALILVLGCSGDDRRLGDLLASRTDRISGRSAEVVWLHFEPTPPVPARAIGSSLDSFLTCPTNSPAAFLRHTLFDLTGRFPQSSHPYPSHPTVPVPFGKQSRGAPLELRGGSGGADSYTSKLNVASSEELLSLASACANNGFVVIWVDLEAIHTLAGLVGAIIDGCRRVDVDLPPAVMPVGGFGQSAKGALARLEHALQRHRYAVFVDGVDAYGSPLLMHHSPPEADRASEVKGLNCFLAELKGRSLGQSIIVASLERPGARRSSPDPEPGPLLEIPDRKGPCLLWLCLTVIRRTRPLPSLRHLLGPLVPGPDTDERNVDDFLYREAANENSPLRMLEGGELWFKWCERDRVYDSATRFTGSKFFESLKQLDHPSDPLKECALAQSVLVGLLHWKIANTYFTFEYRQSGDAAAFMECTYHRISSIRYLSRDIYLLNAYPGAWKGAVDRIQEEVLKPVEEANSEFKADQYFPSIWKTVTTPGDVGVREAAVERLRQERVKELDALLVSWQECEQAVRSQIPAEQLIRWVEEIIGKDMMTRLSGVFAGPVLHEDNCHLIGPKCEEFRQYFSRLLVRIHFERGDFKKALKRLKQTPDADLDARLDCIECLINGGQLEHARSILKTLGSPGKGSDEFGHRFRHLSALLALGGPTGLEEGTAQPGPTAPGRKTALEWAHEGLEGVRAAGPVPAPKGMVVSSGSLGNTGGFYQSVFRVLKGRAKVAQLLQTDPNKSTLLGDLSTFRDAMRQFDQAKGGLGTHQPQLRGWADLHAAESTLLLARRLFEHADQGALGAIEAKLRNCSTHLQNGLGALRTGRRNALWWRHYYQLTAQYHTERLFVALCRLDEAQLPSTDKNDRRISYGIDLFRCFVRALETVAAFADYSLQRKTAFKAPWVHRTLAELHLAAAVAVAHFEGKSDRTMRLRDQLAENLVTVFEPGYPASLVDSKCEKQMLETDTQASDLLAALGTKLAGSMRPDQLGRDELRRLVRVVLAYSASEYPRAMSGQHEQLSLLLQSSVDRFVQSPPQSDLGSRRWRGAVVDAVRQAQGAPAAPSSTVPATVPSEPAP